MITVTSRQSVLDIALQHCGALEAAFDIAISNGISLSDDLAVGQQLVMPEPTDKMMARHYNVNGILPATAITTEEINDALNIGDGIGFWSIEIDFIVQ